jgi:hypothetical protein
MGTSHCRAQSQESEYRETEAARPQRRARATPADMPVAFGNSDLLELLGRSTRSTSPAPKARGLSQVCSKARTGMPFREEMENAFHQDFSTTTASLGNAELCQTAGASALTQGEHVAFASTSPDIDTVAHEAAHVVQARNAATSGTSTGATSTSRPGDPAEREAETAAIAVHAGEDVQVQRSVPGGEVLGFWDEGSEATVDADTDTDVDAHTTNTDTLTGADTPGAAAPAVPPELQALLGETREQENFQSPKGGRFDARYSPDLGLLEITLKVCLSFDEGSATDEIWTKFGFPPSTYGKDNTPFSWTDDEKQTWTQKAKADIESYWSNQYVFHCTRPGWEALRDVEVAVLVLETDANDAHFVVHLPRYPIECGARDYVDLPEREAFCYETGANVSGPPGEADPDVGVSFVTPDDLTSAEKPSARHQADVEIRELSSPNDIYFDAASAQVNADDSARMKKLGGALSSPDAAHFDVSVMGQADLDDEVADPKALSEERAQNVAELIMGGGQALQVDHDGAGLGLSANKGADQKAYVSLSAVFEQETILHEVGHMFGLADEYPEVDPENGLNRPPGAYSRNTAEIDRTMNDVPGRENVNVQATFDESIMSAGMEFRPQHYVTFLEALEALSNVKEWALGAGKSTNVPASTSTQ